MNIKRLSKKWFSNQEKVLDDKTGLQKFIATSFVSAAMGALILFIMGLCNTENNLQEKVFGAIKRSQIKGWNGEI